MVFQYVHFAKWLIALCRREADRLYPSPKSFPWFVSDVTPVDFSDTIRALQQPELWATNVGPDGGQANTSASETNTGSEALKELARRFQDRVQSGQFELSVGLDTPFGMLSMKASHR